MAKQSNKKTVRRCSICRKTGHTKRHCPEQEMKKTSPKGSTNKSVVVRVIGDAGSSPHVVDLKDRAEASLWKGVQTFREKHEPKEIRVTVDPAAKMRQDKIKLFLQKHHITPEKPLTAEQRKKIAEFRNQLKSITPNFGDQTDEWQLPVESILEAPVPRKQKKTFEKELAGLLSGTPLKAEKGRWKRFIPQSALQMKWKKIAYASVALFLVAALPWPALSYYNDIKDTSDEVLNASTVGFLSLQSSTIAAFESDIDTANADVSKALTAFAEAKSVLDKEHKVAQFLAKMIPVVGEKLHSRQQLLTAGHQIALGNTYIIKGLEEARSRGDLPVTDRMQQVALHVSRAIPQYDQALEALSDVEISALPLEHQNTFAEFKVLFAAFVDDLHDLNDVSATLAEVFGSEDLRTYLVVFQNNREMRATGGFMGSAALIDVEKGKIHKIEVPGGGLYDWKGQLDTHVKPPLPLQLVNTRWEPQDANWWPDFEASAKKLQWFYEHSRGATVDGVIAVNATVFENLLRIIGPIENKEHGVVLAADDALDTLQYKVEVDYDKQENKPKEIIGDVLKQILGADTNKIDALKMLSLVHEGLQSKDIQLQFNDTNHQSKVAEYGWTGKIVPIKPWQDYLYVVNTNIQGAKSDGKIEQAISHQVEVQADGRAIVTTVIKRTHTGQAEEQFSGSPNVNYLRVYVPKGTELLEAGGFQYPPDAAFKTPESYAVDDEDLMKREHPKKYDDASGTLINESFDKTVFENWVMTAPGETSEVYFVYELPFNVLAHAQQKAQTDVKDQLIETVAVKASTYSVIVQKQSGVESDFESTIIYPSGWKPTWRSSDYMDLALNGGLYRNPLSEDTILGLVMEKEQQ